MKYYHYFQNEADFNNVRDNNYEEPWVSLTESVNRVDYNKLPPPPLTFEIQKSGNITWKTVNTAAKKTISYSVNGGAWSEITSTTAGVQIPVLSGDTIQFKGNNNTYCEYINYTYLYNMFYGTASFRAYGNIMSLIDGDNYTTLDTFPSGSNRNFYGLFSGCTGLTDIQELVLPATALTSSCYSNMFYSCRNLKTIMPKLPATVLANSCYSNMFMYCTSLVAQRDFVLPATELKYRCYYQMFKNCSTMGGRAPELPATTMATDCYRSMFEYSRITYAPELPATVLSANCYYQMFRYCQFMTKPPTSIGTSSTVMTASACTEMFYGCSALSGAPALPSTALAPCCYFHMFSYCNGLKALPELPATTLAEWCYFGMFENCIGLETIPQNYLPATTLANSCYNSMFRSCTSLRTLPNLPATTLANSCYSNMFGSCYSLTSIPSNYLPVTALTPYCYDSMFQECSGVTTLPNLPATTLTEYCYKSMFQGCTSLTTIPNNYLPATNLSGGNNCYRHMFQLCQNLSSVPTNLLPATTLADYCYAYMFSKCSSLQTAPELPAQVLKNQCYRGMFNGCSLLVNAPSTIGSSANIMPASACTEMFAHCTSLTTSPILPAETLGSWCYGYMFSGCTNLNTITCLATDKSATNCVGFWTTGVQNNSGTFYKNTSTTSTFWSGDIPNRWTVADYQ